MAAVTVVAAPAGDARAGGGAEPSTAAKIGAFSSNVMKSFKMNQDCEGSSIGFERVRADGATWSLTAAGLEKILRAMRASPDQLECFQVFAAAVLQPLLDAAPSRQTSPRSPGSPRSPRSPRSPPDDWAVRAAGPRSGASAEGDEASAPDLQNAVFFSADLRSLDIKMELQHFADLTAYVGKMLEDCGMPLAAATAHGDWVAELMDAVGEAPSSYQIWWRADRMGMAVPGIDFGVAMTWSSVPCPLEWGLVELMLPACDDKDLLIEFGMSCVTDLAAIGISRSLLTEEPETAVLFKMKSGHSAPLNALMFFKALDFALPHDQVLMCIAGARQKQVGVTVAFGPKGLTRVSMQLAGIDPKVGARLANMLDFEYRDRDLLHCAAALSAKTFQLLDYSVEARGYTISMGFGG